MTIREAMEQADRERENDVPVALKITWLSELEGRLTQELLAPRGMAAASCGFTLNDSLETVLAAPDVYAEIYPAYLLMKYDFVNGETGRLANSTALFNRLYFELSAFCSRNARVQKNTRIKAGKLYV